MYHKDCTKSYGHRPDCRICNSKSQKQKEDRNFKLKVYRQQNPAVHQNAHLKKNFGITLTQYDLMLTQQEQRCAICKKHKFEFTRNLAVDHSHTTGQIRRLLCYGCNTGIGMLKENIEIMTQALNYIKEWNEKDKVFCSKIA